MNLRTIGITLLCVSGAVTLAALGYFTVRHHEPHEPILLGLFLALIILLLPHYAFWNRITKSSFLQGLVVSFTLLSTLITIYLYWANIFLSHEAERVLVFGLVPGLQLLLYSILWVIIRVSGGK